MGAHCQVCGKKAVRGNSITTRGKAKYLGGVGTKVTGITRRLFKPNLQSVHVTDAGGRNLRMKVCTQCLRSGAIRKTVRLAPFRLPAHEPAAQAPAKAASPKKKSRAPSKKGAAKKEGA